MDQDQAIAGANQQNPPPEASQRSGAGPRRQRQVGSVVIPAKAGQANAAPAKPKSGLRERNEALLFSSVMSDVAFAVGPAEGPVERIPAHSFILASASEVFYAQFYGAFEKPAEIRVPDVEAAAFRDMLRFLYTDEVEVVGERVEGLLYSGAKYHLAGLTEAAVRFLDGGLCAESVCATLAQAQLFGEAALERSCWELLDAKADRALLSQGFAQLDRPTVRSILARETLNAPEALVFRAAEAWGTAEAERQGLALPRSAEAVREALGEVLFDVRLAALEPKEFADGPARSPLLSDSEVRALFLWQAGSRSELRQPQWPCERRSGLAVQRCGRFASAAFRSNQWRCRGRCDAVEFSVDRRVWVVGVGLYGSSGGAGEYEVKAELKDAEGRVLGASRGSVVSEGSSEVLAFRLREVVQVEPERWYTLSVVLKGAELTFFGQEGRSEVVAGPATFSFQASIDSTNGTGVQGGQIPEILFYAAQRDE